MQIAYIKYDQANGNIISHGSMDSSIFDEVNQCDPYLIATDADPFRSYVDLSTLAVLPIPATGPSRDDLLNYASLKWQQIIMQGEVSAGAFQASTADVWRAWLTDAIAIATALPSNPVLWNGTRPITLAQLQALGVAVGVFCQAAWAVYGQAKTAIAAGTITANAEIDAMPWPMNS